MLEQARPWRTRAPAVPRSSRPSPKCTPANAARNQPASAARPPLSRAQPDRPHRIIPTSRPRYTEEERKAMLEQMRREQEERKHNALAGSYQPYRCPPGPQHAWIGSMPGRNRIHGALPAVSLVDPRPEPTAPTPAARKSRRRPAELRCPSTAPSAPPGGAEKRPAFCTGSPSPNRLEPAAAPTDPGA